MPRKGQDMQTAPILLQYDGDGIFVPCSTFHARSADKHYVIGERYRMVEQHERSDGSHNHFFASIKNGFDNLPDDLREEFPSTEHLRKKALIRKGYCDERSIACASKAEAFRLASFIRPMDDYAIVNVRECVVRVWTARSQSRRAMGVAEFQNSKQDVLDFIDDLLGVDRGSTAASEAA